MREDLVGVLRVHVRRFNDAVRSHDFSEMIEGFAADANMEFEGVPVGPFVGRDAIAEAYRDNLPTTRFACSVRRACKERPSSPTMRGPMTVDVPDG